MRFRVQGRVQGVGFRAFVADRARRLAVLGWVRNRPDGAVEGVAEGETGALETLVTQLQRGPALSRVDDCHLDWSEASGGYDEFRIRP